MLIAKMQIQKEQNFKESNYDFIVIISLKPNYLTFT